MKEIESIVVDEVHQILPRANAMACGSYRRGKETSGDCDILITDPDEEECGMLPGTVFIYPDLFRSQILFIRATRTSSPQKVYHRYSSRPPGNVTDYLVLLRRSHTSIGSSLGTL